MSSNKKYMQRYREKNKEKIREQNKKYRETHQEQIKAYRESHRKQIREYSKQYRENHHDEVIEYGKKYREAHREELNEKRLKYYYDNYDREKETEKMRKWRKKCLDTTKPYADKSNKHWTVEDMELLSILLEEGFTATEIAINLGRTRCAVDRKIRDIRKAEKQNKETIQQELQDLIELYRINSSLGGD